MSAEVVSVRTEDVIHDALNLMLENRVSALPVVDQDGKCVGILSTSDLMNLTHDLEEDVEQLGEADLVAQRWILEKFSEDGRAERQVTEYMSESVTVATADALLSSAAQEMLKAQVHRLPLVDEAGLLIGILSTMDVVKVFVKGIPE